MIKIKETLTNREVYGRDVLQDYFKILQERCGDFPEVKEKYEKAYKRLEKVFKYTESLAELHEQMVASNLLFSFELGVEDNLKHFRNPSAPTFLEEDYEEALKEKEMRKAQGYVSANEELKSLRSFMPIGAEDIYEEMLEYYAFLDVYIPKMAHYYGYMTANQTLKKTLPEYKEDRELNIAYTQWLRDYLDLRLP